MKSWFKQLVVGGLMWWPMIYLINNFSNAYVELLSQPKQFLFGIVAVIFIALAFFGSVLILAVILRSLRSVKRKFPGIPNPILWFLCWLNRDGFK